jgi:hypothetical protein
MLHYLYWFCLGVREEKFRGGESSCSDFLCAVAALFRRCGNKLGLGEMGSRRDASGGERTLWNSVLMEETCIIECLRDRDRTWIEHGYRSGDS